MKAKILRILFFACLLTSIQQTTQGIEKKLSAHTHTEIQQTTASKQSQEKLGWQEALETAFQYNPDFQVTQIKLQQAEGQALTLKSELLPKIDLRATSSPVVLTLTGTQLIASRASLPILKAGHAIRSAARINVELEALELVWKLRRAFAAALYSQTIRQLQAKRAELFDQRLKRAPSLFEGGQLTRANLVALEVKTSLAQQDLAKAQLEEEKAFLDLDDIMGITSEHPLFGKRLEATFDSERKLAFSLKEYTEYAYQNRTDLQALRELKLAADQRIYITSAQSWPALYAEGSLRREDELPAPLNEVEKIFKSENSSSGDSEEEDNVKNILNSTASVGIKLSWKIFDGGKTLGQVRSAQAQAISQDVLLDQTQHSIGWQVRTAYEVFENLSTTLAKLEEKNASKKSVQLAHTLFEQGVISQLEVLDAFEEDIAFRLGRVQVLYSMEIARAHLDYVTGYSTRFLPEASSQLPMQEPR